MEQPLISVVIPAYNVASYLPRCLDSLIRQTYERLEIIVVNDGSTDTTEAVIQQYQKDHSQIHLVSQKNAGVSAARNAGLHTATGEYLLFIDADDYVSDNYVQYLYDLLQKYDADISTCRTWQFFEGDSPKPDTSPENIRTYSGVGALEKVLYRDGIQAVPFGKMFKKAVVEGLCFPVGIIYAEDFSFISQALNNSNKVVQSDRSLYYYLQRSGSVCHTFDLRKLAALDMGLQGEDLVKRQCPQIMPAAKSRTFVYAVQALRDLPYGEKAAQEGIQYASKLVRERRKTVLRDAKNKPWIRFLALLAYVHPKLTGLVGKMYTWVKIHARVSSKF